MITVPTWLFAITITVTLVVLVLVGIVVAMYWTNYSNVSSDSVTATDCPYKVE